MSSDKLLLNEEVTKPSKAKIYFELARLHKLPAGANLVFWPCAWALTMASYRTSRPPLLLAFDLGVWCLGSILLHSAACVLNDICDVNVDRQVERTKNRPLARGLISISSAWIYLLFLTLASIGLLRCADEKTFYVGLIGVFPLHAIYPLMKHITYWPQAWLGLAMNWGIPTAWVFLVPSSQPYDSIPLALFLGSACWTIIYDTIYGCQDKADDPTAGVKSTSLLFGSYVRPILAAFSIVFLSALAYAGWANGQGWGYMVGSVGGAALHLGWQLGTLKPDVPGDCWVKFKSNGDLGFIVFAGILTDYALKML